MFGDTTDQRVVAEDSDRLPYGCYLRSSKRRVVFGVEGEDPLKIFQCALGERYLRQALGLGRLARLPSARAVM